MNRIKTMLMAMIAVLAIGAVGASVSQAAGTGNLTIQVGSDPPVGCDFTFNNDPWSGTTPSWSADIYDVAAVPGNCDVSSIEGDGTITKNSSGGASFSGDFEIDVAIGGVTITCRYAGSASGTWAYSGTSKVFTWTTGSINWTGGNWLCPGGPFGGANPTLVSMDAVVN